MTLAQTLAKLDPSILFDERFTESDEALALQNQQQAEEYPKQTEDMYRETEEQLIKEECESLSINPID